MDLCRACFNICDPSDASPVLGLLKEKLLFCIPELNLNVGGNPMLCPSCKSTLEIANDFKTKCLDSQKKLEIVSKYIGIKNVPTNKPETVPSSGKTRNTVEKVAPFKLNLRKVETPSKEEYNETQFPRRRFTDVTMNKPRKTGNEYEGLENWLDKSKNVWDQGRSSANSPTNEESDSNVRFPCKTCNKVFKNEPLLDAHMRSAAHKANEADIQKGEKVHKCKYCLFETKLRIGLNKHYLTCPGKLEEENGKEQNKPRPKMITCQICSAKMAGWKQNFVRHMKSAHNVILTKLKCSKCDYVATSTRDLLVHLKKFHANKKNSSKTTKDLKVFICAHNGCERTFRTKKGLSIHAVVHETTKYNCKICNKIIKGQRYYRAHMTRHQADGKDTTTEVNDQKKSLPNGFENADLDQNVTSTRNEEKSEFLEVSAQSSPAVRSSDEDMEIDSVFSQSNVESQ